MVVPLRIWQDGERKLRTSSSDVWVSYLMKERERHSPPFTNRERIRKRRSPLGCSWPNGSLHRNPYPYGALVDRRSTYRWTLRRVRFLSSYILRSRVTNAPVGGRLSVLNGSLEVPTLIPRTHGASGYTSSCVLHLSHFLDSIH